MNAHVIGAPVPRYYAVPVQGASPVTYCVRDGVYDGEHCLEAIVCYVPPERATQVVDALNLADAGRALYPVSVMVSAAIKQSSRAN